MTVSFSHFVFLCICKIYPLQLPLFDCVSSVLLRILFLLLCVSTNKTKKKMRSNGIRSRSFRMNSIKMQPYCLHTKMVENCIWSVKSQWINFLFNADDYFVPQFLTCRKIDADHPHTFLCVNNNKPPYGTSLANKPIQTHHHTQIQTLHFTINIIQFICILVLKCIQKHQFCLWIRKRKIKVKEKRKCEWDREKTFCILCVEFQSMQ